MDRFKKIVLTLIIVLLFTSYINVNAEKKSQTTNELSDIQCSKTKSKDYSTSCSGDIKEHYGITYEIGNEAGTYYLTASRGTFKISSIEEGYYDGGKKFTPNALKSVTHLVGNVSDYVNNPNKLLVGKNTTGTDKAKKITIKTKSYSGDLSSGYYALKITLVPAVSDCKCQTPEDFKITKDKNESSGTFTDYVYIILMDYEHTNRDLLKNENYDKKACQTIRSAQNGTPTNYANFDQTIFEHIAVRGKDANYEKKMAKYRELLNYCFDKNVGVIQNYTEAQVKQMVQLAIQSTYATYLPQTIYKDQSWNDSAKRACLAGKGTWDDNQDDDHKCTGASGETWQILNEGEKARETSKLYCKYDYKSLGKSDNSIGYKYTNINSYYAKTSKVTEKKYKYYYSAAQREHNEGVEDQDSIKCTRVCEEVVDVEYGPPQTTSAGLCIEYQVKVTSHVQCKTDLNVHAPSTGEMCLPIPVCVHSWGEKDQAGPSDEFEECIDKCDGGEYTDTCSKKCYNEAYKSSSTTKKISNDTQKGVVKFVDIDYSGINVPHGGYYKRVYHGPGDYSIEWVSEVKDGITNQGTKSYGSGTYADYYFLRERERTLNDHGTSKGQYFADDGGFKRQRTKNDACNGNCTHHECGLNKYLNEKDMQVDYEANIALYNDVVTACAAQATCTESTAEFSIGAKVGDKWYDYPLVDGQSPSKDFTDLMKKYGYKNVNTVDKLVSKEKSGSKSNNNQKTSHSILLNWNGCYNNSDYKDWYQAEWTFPGTWSNNKTGEISYFDKGSDKTWNQTKNSFCLPLNLPNVNEKWWFYVKYNDTIGKTATNKNSYLTEEYKKLHPEVFSQTEMPKTIDDWNIKASTVEFGYFKWKFMINCFYAIYTEDQCACKGQKGCSCTTSNLSNTETRNVVNSELFPSTNDDSGSSKHNPNLTGRQPGYNWSEAASIMPSKNPYYAVNPAKLITKIQTIGDGIYDEQNKDEYLEYEFKLSKEKLSEIRKIFNKYNEKNGNYTYYSDDGFQYNKDKRIYIYRSSLVRKYASVYPSESELGCNNLSYNKCELSEGGEN